MSLTRERDKAIAKPETIEKWGENWRGAIGRLGGQKQVKKGFANMDPLRHKEVSSKGGKGSKKNAPQ